MNADPKGFVSDIAFTDQVKAEQSQRGSRAIYAKMAERRDWQSEITADLASFIAERDSIYLSTSNAAGQPYIQHRGGQKGFLRVLDNKRLAFADFGGNRQYITIGNLAENDKAFIFLMDYAHRQRIKIWGRAQVMEDDDDLLASLSLEMDRGKGERVILFEVDAWDVNCSQHITPRYDEDTVARALEKLTVKVAHLERENEALKARLQEISV